MTRKCSCNKKRHRYCGCKLKTYSDGVDLFKMCNFHATMITKDRAKFTEFRKKVLTEVYGINHGRPLFYSENND